MVAVLLIMIILLAVLALIVVNALKASPWGLFTIACTIPIALLMGWWMKQWRPGKVGEASIVGALLLLAALVGGGYVGHHPVLGPVFTHTGTSLVWMMVAYGFVASALPVWMLLAPRDYLSTFLEDRDDIRPGAGHLHPAAPAQDAGADAVRPARRRTGLRGEGLPVRVHHDRLRGHLRVPLADRVGHHPEDDFARKRRALHRLRRHADGIVRRRHGDDRGLHPRSGRLLRDEHHARCAGPGVRRPAARGIRGIARCRCRSSRPAWASRRWSRAPAARPHSRSA